MKKMKKNNRWIDDKETTECFLCHRQMPLKLPRKIFGRAHPVCWIRMSNKIVREMKNVRKT